MKLPPAALTAPSLCPRCDSPATTPDYCIQCLLPLRRCGSCHGVAGPFDRHCGFCGYELVQGERRLPLWRLWLLAAMIPLVAGLAFGLSPYSAGAAHSVTGLVRAASTPSPVPSATRDSSLAVSYALPSGWSASHSFGFAVLVHWPADAGKVTAAGADLVQVRPQASVLEFGRPAFDAPAVDPGDPQAVLGYQVGQLLQAPPTAGSAIGVVHPVKAVTVGGRPAAEAALKITDKDGRTFYFERVWISSP
ncbi:MAG TPA: hypothetical protein VF137_02360, partial [Candidatus Dormibacteraeota bacterium]